MAMTGKFMAANKRDEIIMAHEGSPIPPTKIKTLEISDQNLLIANGFNPRNFIKFE